MLGAILGDIIGSPYEFKERISPDEFELITEQSHVTDDTIMTLAVAQGMMEGENSNQRTRERIRKNMHELGQLYPDAGYGTMFKKWLKDPEARPYASWGNGAVMRVSSIGWLTESLGEARRYAALSASVSHDHPYAVNGAQAVACTILMAREGYDIEDMKAYLEQEFGYNFSPQTINELEKRVWTSFDLSLRADITTVLSLNAFFTSPDFESAVRKAVGSSPDTDTSAAVTGGVAEAYYGIPYKLRKKGLAKLDQRQSSIYRSYLKTVEDR